jgi:hypothetical protein
MEETFLIKTARLLLLLSLSRAIAAQDLPQLPAETLSLLQEVRALDPEFSADNLLRLAGSRVIPDPAWKRQLIEEAFKAGGRAPLPYRRLGIGSTDARASRAYRDNGLEALTLQTRAVDAMLELDAHRARAMFEEIPSPQVPAMTCQDVGTPVLTAYYSAAARVLDRGFTPEQREKLQHMQVLKRVIDLMQSPAHVTPAVKLIFTANVTPDQRQELVSSFAGMLPRINGTSRVFSSTMFQLVPVSAPRQLPPGINGLPPMLDAPAGQLPPQVVAAAPLLLHALRAYIVRYVGGPRCSDDIRGGQLPTAVNDFNYLVSALDPVAATYKPISQDEAKPARDAGTYESDEWWQSSRSKQVLDALKWLNHGNRNLPGNARFFTLEERMSQEWNTHFVDALRLLEGWKESEESSPDDWFGMVSEAYETISELAPPGRQREVVMARYLNFMETHYASVANHNLWFTQLHNQWRSKDPWMVEQLMNSGNPVISAYSKVSRRIAE